ncbi:sugar transferase [Roseateles oligotrophus]|uniref:Sugar transferase n=1 Tax=Roseateles oligotrophus TaxID=1769250 RepID=A0ABT2YFW0_9BURK|nr:sugar transferase [Roseateles oligotrophus]MCV2368893.1 sugar transferase [Roseateles oligotrophus]
MSTTPALSNPRINRWRARRALWAWRLLVQGPAAAKRGLDLLLVLPALLLLTPLLLLVALAICCCDGGPVLFWQTRVGRHGRIFNFPKFRSMRVDAEATRAQLLAANQHGASGVTFKMARDPRITPVGRWLRRFSIDELPQLWCVLCGHMTLVGPRPPLVSEVARYTLRERQRLTVTPGLTCIWQVNGRSEVPFPQQVQMDLDYIQQASLWADIKLILKTLPAVIRGRGAY